MLPPEMQTNTGELAGYRPGAIANVISMHMAYYGPKWGFGRPFEAKLAAELGEFHSRYDPARDLFILLTDGEGSPVGTISVDGSRAEQIGFQIRWFIVTDRAQGKGLGLELMRRADRFLVEKQFKRAFLTTFRGLDRAQRLYERFGFSLVSETESDPWSGNVGQQLYVRRSVR